MHPGSAVDPVSTPAGDAEPRPQPGQAASSSTHGHLWALPDGTGLHAPPGRLSVDPDDGRLCCHLCGQWFVSLASHVRSHGYTADGYRAAMGLLRGRGLVAPDLSATIRRRQARAYRASDHVRSRFAANQARARRGELAQRALRSNTAHDDRPERRRGRAEQLDAGRATSAQRRERRLAARLGAADAPTLADHLSEAYAAGASLEDLRRTTGLGRDRLHKEMAAAGIMIRPPGANTSTGKRSRAGRAEIAAALRVGTGDLPDWLGQRRAAGWTLTQLAAAVGHSTYWVRWRLPAESA